MRIANVRLTHLDFNLIIFAKMIKLKLIMIKLIYILEINKIEKFCYAGVICFYEILELVHNIQQVLIAVYFMINDISRRKITE